MSEKEIEDLSDYIFVIIKILDQLNNPRDGPIE